MIEGLFWCALGDCYRREHLVELEHIISESILQGSVVILGKFNAHLSDQDSDRANTSNLLDVMHEEMTERC